MPVLSEGWSVAIDRPTEITVTVHLTDARKQSKHRGASEARRLDQQA